MFRSLATAAAAVLLGLLALSTAAPERVRCFEDEVVVWDGDAHTRCVPLDDIIADTRL